jgi:hypothetical protein
MGSATKILNRPNMNHEINESKYSIALQDAMMELLGERWDGTAGLFTTNRYTGSVLKKAVKKIQIRLEEITATDDRLSNSCLSQIKCLESEIKKFSQNKDNLKDNLLDITAHLLTLIALLIGYDYCKGIPNRCVIYYQTKEQQEIDNRFLRKNNPPLEDESKYYQLVEIATILQKKGYSIIHIADIMNRRKEIVRHWLNNSIELKK